MFKVVWYAARYERVERMSLGVIEDSVEQTVFNFQPKDIPCAQSAGGPLYPSPSVWSLNISTLISQT